MDAAPSQFSYSKLLEPEGIYHDYEYPKVSVIIPTYLSAPLIRITLDSILMQDYPSFEVVVIDGGSTDGTIEIIESYHDERVKICSGSGLYRYEMLNSGIVQSEGTYLNIMFPGDVFISLYTLKVMMNLALTQNRPHLVYCGALLRDGKSDVKMLNRPLNLLYLQRGRQPTALQSCWFRKDLFDLLGKFDTSYQLKSGYEFLCRFALNGQFSAVGSSNVFVDFDLRWVTKNVIIRNFFETFRVIYKCFGLWALMRWIVIQKDMKRYLILWARGIKLAFLGK